MAGIHKPTTETRVQVKKLASFGLIDAQIAAVIGVSAPTLRKYYEIELLEGLAVSTERVARTLYEKATDPEKPNMTAAIFWLKCKGGWNDRPTAKEYVKKEDREKEKAEKVVSSGFFANNKVKLVK